MHKLIACLIPCLALTLTAAPLITDVTVQKAQPWNGEVVLTYSVSENIDDWAAANHFAGSLMIRAENKRTGQVFDYDGVLEDSLISKGTHAVSWNLASQISDFASDEVEFKVTYEPHLMRYCVLDLSNGPSAGSYPVTYLDEIPEGGWSDEYKLTKLVLRLLDPGSFILGEDQTDESHRVYFDKPSYMGVFEVTQTQYALVMGVNPSAHAGGMRPVESVPVTSFRGYYAVEPNSFIGRLRAKSGLLFDLPSEARWEYACRAGTNTSYNDGTDGVETWQEITRSWESRMDGRGGFAEHTTVGLYAPNAWGFYDMHGNVAEFCLDLYNEYQIYGYDPVQVNSTSGAYVLRGGSWHHLVMECSSHWRMGGSVKNVYEHRGFRLARSVTEALPLTIEGCSDAVSIELCAPIIQPVSGTTFDSSLTVSMSCASEGATIYYTTDGTEPTMDSPVYKRFRVNGKTTVKARAFYENGEGSEIVTAEYALGRCADPVIVSAGGETFQHSDNLVTIRAAREGSGGDSEDQVIR